MKVHRLWIGQHRVLNGLELTFSPSGKSMAEPETGHNLDLLVGVNGTGKSTVLRALADVFRQIEQGTSDDDFRFSVTYERSPGDLVTVENVLENREPLSSGFRVQIAGKDFQFESSAQHLSPARYVTYTTGGDAGWERTAGKTAGSVARRAWDETVQDAYWRRERPGAPNTREAEDAAPSSSHLHIRPQDLPLVTLCGLVEHASRTSAGNAPRGVLGAVLAELGVRRMSAFALRLRPEPGAASREEREELTALQKAADRVRVQGASLAFIFDGRGNPEELRERLVDALDAESMLGLFQRLVRFARPRGEYRPLLQQVEIFFEKEFATAETVPDLHTYEWLSDGERTFLGRMCMLSLFGAANALILLDEPEVHFNDYWKRKLVSMLDDSLRGHHSHAILTTHSSIVLTDVRREQILVLDRGADRYTRRALTPDFSTLTADPSDVLMQIFGAEQASGDKGVREVRELLEPFEGTPLSERLSTRDNEALRQRLTRARDELAPGYWRFRVLDALAQLPADATQA